MNSYGAVDWALYLVIQADGALHEPAVRAVSDLQTSIKKHRNGAPGTIHVVVDLLEKESATRCVFTTDGEYDSEQTTYGIDPVGYIKEGAACAFTQEACQTMLIFSGHGSGVITPRWDESMQKWLAERDEGESPYTHYYREQDKLFYEKVHQALEVKSLFLRRDGKVLFSQPQLNDVLNYVGNDLLHGRKIDIVGFDSCHMAMLEIAYDLRFHARYLVASQECEQKEGWDYTRLADLLFACGDQMARSIVFGYETAQRKKDKTLYSLSALDLRYVDEVAASLDRIIETLNQVPSTDAQELMIALIKARHNNQRFTAMTSYADLTTFCDALLEELSLLFETPQITQVKNAVLDLLFTTNQFIIASCAGSSCSKALGCSIYFPVSHCDSSYRNAFEQEHSWRKFVEGFIGDLPVNKCD